MWVKNCIRHRLSLMGGDSYRNALLIFTVTQVGDHIVGRNMVFACFLSCIDTRNEAGIQKVLGVLLIDAGNAIELVFRHSVGIFFEYFIAL